MFGYVVLSATVFIFGPNEAEVILGQEYRELFKSIDSCEEFMVDQIPNDEDWVIKEVDHDIVIEQTVEYQHSTVKLTKKCAYIELYPQ